MACRNGRRRSSEGSCAVLSQPFGRPLISGNGIVVSWILGYWAIPGLMEAAFDGVVMIVILRPRRERAFDMSSKGRMWPWDMKGNNIMWGGEAMVFSTSVQLAYV